MKIDAKWAKDGTTVNIEFHGNGEQFCDEAMAIFEGVLNFCKEESEFLHYALIAELSLLLMDMTKNLEHDDVVGYVAERRFSNVESNLN